MRILRSFALYLAACLSCGTFCYTARIAQGGSAEDWAKMKLITPRGYVCGFRRQAAGDRRQAG